MVGRENRAVVTDVRVLAALSHPVRVQLINFLLEVGPSTATQCAAAVDASPSACSYHLRHMAGFGLVERAEAGSDGRERLWRCTSTGYTYGGPPSADDPSTSTIRHALTAAALDDKVRLAKRYLAAEQGLSSEWRDAAVMSTYGLMISAEELATLQAALDALIRPFIAATRVDPPNGAERVRVSLEMFRRIDS